MLTETHPWLPPSAESTTLRSRWHYLRGRLNRLRRPERISLESPLEREIAQACSEDTPETQGLSRLTAYLRGYGFDTVEALEGLDVSHTTLILGMVQYPRMAPLLDSLWRTCRQMVEEESSSPRGAVFDNPNVPAPVKKILLYTKAATRAREPVCTLQLARLHEMLQDALSWPPADMVPMQSIMAPIDEETLQLQGYAINLLLNTGGLTTTAAIDKSIETACAREPGWLWHGASDPKRDMAFSLLTMQTDPTHQSYALLCLWGWRWLQQHPEFATTALFENVGQRMASLPIERLGSLGLTEDEAAAMLHSSVGSLRTVGWLAVGQLPPKGDATPVLTTPLSAPPSTPAPSADPLVDTTGATQRSPTITHGHPFLPR